MVNFHYALIYELVFNEMFVMFLNFQTIMLFPQKSLLKRLMRTTFTRGAFVAKQLLQIAVYHTPFNCLTWSKQLKSCQTTIFLQTALVTQHPLYCMPNHFVCQPQGLVSQVLGHLFYLPSSNELTVRPMNNLRNGIAPLMVENPRCPITVHRHFCLGPFKPHNLQWMNQLHFLYQLLPCVCYLTHIEVLSNSIRKRSYRLFVTG